MNGATRPSFCAPRRPVAREAPREIYVHQSKRLPEEFFPKGPASTNLAERGSADMVSAQWDSAREDSAATELR